MRFQMRARMDLWALTAAAWFLLVVPAFAQQPVQQPEEVLRARVTEFYTLLQKGQTTRAEAYVTRDSVDEFRRSDPGPMLGLEISSVEMDPSGESAVVTVQILFKHPLVPASTLRFPRTTTWQVEDGAWRVVIVPQPPGSVGGMGPGHQAKPEPSRPPDLQFSEKEQDLGILEAGGKKSFRFSFKNITDHPVTITSVETGCPCLTVQSGLKTYQPGETGELALEFDSTGYSYYYKQTIVVKTEPGHGTISLLVEAKSHPRRSTAPARPPGSAAPSGPNP
jgi:hypothetical protein